MCVVSIEILCGEHRMLYCVWRVQTSCAICGEYINLVLYVASIEILFCLASMEKILCCLWRV